MNLEDCRRQINELDDQLITLFVQRMNVAEEVARQKIQAKLPVFFPEREKAIIQRLTQRVPSHLAEGVKQLYETIFTISRNRQHELIQAHQQDTQQER